MKTAFKTPDYAKIRNKLNEAAEKLKCAAAFSDVRDAFGIYNEAYTEISSQYGRLFLMMYHDVSNPETMQLFSEHITPLSELVHYAPFGAEVLASPFFNEIIACYGHPAISLLKFNAMCEQTRSARNTPPPSLDETVMKYQNLVIQAKGCYEQFADDFDDLLEEAVRINHETALYYGYENYCDYANLMYSRFDYGEAEIMQLCRQVRTEAVPFYEQFRKTYDNQLKQKQPLPKNLREGMAAYTKALGTEAANYWAQLDEKNALDIDASPVKMPNMGLQRFIEEDGLGPLITNPTGIFADGWVLAHEFGHSFQEYLAFHKQTLALNAVASADVMEISSRLMELFLHGHAGCLYENPERFALFHLDSLLRSIIDFAMSTEYEHWLYHHVNATKAERREAYRALYCQTHPSAGADETQLLRKLYDETTVFTMPKYQFCYVPAWMNALEMAKDYLHHPEQSYHTFLHLSADLAFYGYNELMERFGLTNVFREGSLEKFFTWFTAFLNCSIKKT